MNKYVKLLFASTLLSLFSMPAYGHYYIHIDDLYNGSITLKKGNNKIEQYKDTQLKALKTIPLPENTTICYFSENEESKTKITVKLVSSETRSFTIKNLRCKTLNAGWSSVFNRALSVYTKFKSTILPAPTQSLLSASYNIGGNRGVGVTRGEHHANGNKPYQPYCPNFYTGKAEIQPKFYNQFHVLYEYKLEGKTAKLIKIVNETEKELQTTTIRDAEAVFTNFDASDVGAVYKVVINELPNAAPITLRPLDIVNLRKNKNNLQFVPVIDEESLTGSTDSGYDKELIETLYDLKILADSEQIFFHLNSINQLHEKSKSAYTLYQKVILPKLNEYKLTFCKPHITNID